MAETKDYIVVRNNTLDSKIGDTVKLNEKQAAFLVNKVRLKDDVAAEVSKAGRKSNMERENAELQGKIKSLEVEIGKQKSHISHLNNQIQGNK